MKLNPSQSKTEKIVVLEAPMYTFTILLECPPVIYLLHVRGGSRDLCFCGSTFECLCGPCWHRNPFSCRMNNAGPTAVGLKCTLSVYMVVLYVCEFCISFMSLRNSRSLEIHMSYLTASTDKTWSLELLRLGFLTNEWWWTKDALGNRRANDKLLYVTKC